MPGNIKLITEKGSHTLYLQDALAVVHDLFLSQFIIYDQLNVELHIETLIDEQLSEDSSDGEAADED